MATQASRRASGFLANLGKVYGIYTGGFLAFIILVAILEQLGVPNRVLGYLFVGFTILDLCHHRHCSRAPRRFRNIMWRAARFRPSTTAWPRALTGCRRHPSWAWPATLYALGYDGLAFVLGWTGGYVLVSVLLAPFLRKFGAYTVPDFLAARYGGNLARFLGVIVLHLPAPSPMWWRRSTARASSPRASLALIFTIAVYAGLAGILVCSMLGGMRAVTWTQVAQYIVLIVAYLTPVVILSTQKYGIPVPELMYGQALQDITAREQEMIANGLAEAGKLKPHIIGLPDL